MGVLIKQIEYVYPSIKVTNDDLQKEFKDYNFKKFETRIGIKNRYVASKEETALSLAVKAVDKLFSNKKIKKSDIDFLIYCTQSPEYFLPTSACVIQNKCGLPTKIGAFDINLGCSGYTYGLSLAKDVLNGNSIKNVLLVTSETYSKYINKLDRTNRSLFGDAATASLISHSEESDSKEFLFGTDGAGADSLIVKNGCAFPVDLNPKNKTYGSGNVYNDNNLYMDGPGIFNFTTSHIPEFYKNILDENKMSVKNINQVFFHQANKFMLNTLRRKIKVDSDKFYINLQEGGNTVSCTIPIAIKQFFEKNNIIKKQTLLLLGFGVGLSWCGGIIDVEF
jgi:3-oxoacyl-[acyl-carrier-protein] synthase-3